MNPPHVHPYRSPGASEPPLPTKRRVFSLGTFLAGLAVLVISLALFLALKEAIDDGVRLRGRGWGRIILLLLAGPPLGLAAMVGAFFFRGCSTCKKGLVTREYDFPSTMYPFLAQQLTEGGQALNLFLRAPIELGQHASVLKMEVCEKCERIAAVALSERAPTHDGSHEVRSTPERWLAPTELPWIAALRANRAASR